MIGRSEGIVEVSGSEPIHISVGQEPQAGRKLPEQPLVPFELAPLVSGEFHVERVAGTGRADRST